MELRQYYATFTIIALLVSCATKKESLVQREKTVQNFSNLSNDRKIIYFENLDSPPQDDNEEKVWRDSLRTDDEILLQAALKAHARFPRENLREEYLRIIREKRNITRYHALRALAGLTPRDEDLPVIALGFDDSDWLPRAQSIRMVRLYDHEKEERKFYYTLLTMLDEHNPDVTRELFRTLKWYKEESTFPFLYKRSFHARTDIELIFMLRELVSYPSNLVTLRLRQLERYHKSLLVRNEARELLAKR